MSVACGWRMTFWTIERIKIEVGRPLELWLHYIRCVWGIERALTQTDPGLPSPCHGMRSASVPVEGGSVACTELKALRPLLMPFNPHTASGAVDPVTISLLQMRKLNNKEVRYFALCHPDSK